MLPEKFLENIKKIIPKDFETFLESYNYEPYSGLRVNTLKISVEKFVEIFPFSLKKIDGIENGFYFDRKDNITKHPYYHAGLFYVQEPSAMIPGEVIDIEENDVILDLCAAPGGKTTQIASRMNGTGLLVSNDISTGRVKALIKNIELFGIKNAVVINENHVNLSNKTNCFFDKILIDAPCSGEGMFRKNRNSTSEWSEERVSFYRDIQMEILEEIKKSLKDGGQIIYSTCTFNNVENEEQIENFLFTNNDYFLDDIDLKGEFEVIDKFLRVWPHKNIGEGHFVAKLRKISEPDGSHIKSVKLNYDKPPFEFLDFQKKYLNVELDGNFKIIDNRLYLLPELDIDTSGLRVARSGWLLGDIKNKKFIPSQAFAMGLKIDEFKSIIDLDVNSIEVLKYLKGETISADGNEGYNLVCVNGYPLGFGIIESGKLKNKYHPSWRLSH